MQWHYARMGWLLMLPSQHGACVDGDTLHLCWLVPNTRGARGRRGASVSL